MILDTLEKANRYHGLSPYFPEAFAFLSYARNRPFVPARYELLGKNLIAIIEAGTGRTRQHAPLEAHRRYIDIQFAYSGDEEIGWKPYYECENVSQAYCPDRDIEFFSDTPLVWLPVPKHSFAIFFPEEDAHAPLAGINPVQKIIMKVAVV